MSAIIVSNAPFNSDAANEIEGTKCSAGLAFEANILTFEAKPARAESSLRLASNGAFKI